MFKIAIVTLALIVAVAARVRQCERGALGPLPTAHRITNCPDNNALCEIIRGRTIFVELDFEATSNAVTLRPEVTAYAFGIRAVYDLPADRQIGCNWMIGTFCPLDQGEFATYNLVMPVIDEYPLVKVDIEVRLYDQDNVIQFCTLVECEVVLG